MKVFTAGKNGRLVLDLDALGDLVIKYIQLPSFRLMMAAQKKRIALGAVLIHLVGLCGCGVTNDKVTPDVTGTSLVQVLEAVSDFTQTDDYLKQMEIEDCSFGELCSIYEMAKKEGDLKSCNFLMCTMSSMIMVSQVAEALGVKPIQIIEFSPMVSNNLIIGGRAVEVSYYKSLDDAHASGDVPSDKVTKCILNFEGMMDELAKVLQESQAGRLTLATDSGVNSMSLAEAYSILGEFLLTTPVITKGTSGRMTMDSVYDPVKGQAFLDYVAKFRSDSLRKALVVGTEKWF